MNFLRSHAPGDTKVEENNAAGVNVYQRFSDLPTAGNALFRSSGNESFFLSQTWFRVLAEHGLGAEAGLRLYCAMAEPSGAVQSLLPMASMPLEGRFPCAKILSAAANYYTPLFRPLTASGTRPERWMCQFINAIHAERRWDLVRLFPMDPSSPDFRNLLQAFSAAGMTVQPYRCFSNWYLPVNGRRYAEYLADLPGRLRNTLRRKEQRLNASGSLRIELVSDPAGLELAIPAYEAVYRESWKPPEAHPRFVPQLMHACATEGTLRLGLAFVNGRPAAAQFWIVANGVASIYKLAYSQAFQSQSVGTILTAHLMQHVIDVDRVSEVDFLSGDDTYKRDWMPNQRERWGITAYNRSTPMGALLALRSTVKRQVKKIFGQLHGPGDIL